MGSRWSDDASVARGASYDERFARLAEGGTDIHGEADLVDSVVAPGSAILDAGCGTGRVAIELARRGHRVVGVDLDAAMLATARDKAPELTWVEADLSRLDLGRSFDAVVAAGNVMIFVAEDTEATAVRRCATHLASGGALITGFSRRPGGSGPDDLDAHAAAAGLALEARWATWERDPFEGGDYQVALHRRAATGG